jgi:signal peptidase I
MYLISSFRRSSYDGVCLKMRRVVAAARMVLTVVLVLALGFNLFFLAARLFFGEKMPKIAGISHVVVVTGSMEPAVMPGDLLVVKAKAAYEIGDVVTFRSGASLVTHRIVREQDGGFITRGDSNNTDDAPIDAGQIEGAMVFRIPHLGRVSLALRSHAGMGLVVLAGAVLIVAPVVVGWLRE